MVILNNEYVAITSNITIAVITAQKTLSSLRLSSSNSALSAEIKKYESIRNPMEATIDDIDEMAPVFLIV